MKSQPERLRELAAEIVKNPVFAADAHNTLSAMLMRSSRFLDKNIVNPDSRSLTTQLGEMLTAYYLLLSHAGGNHEDAEAAAISELRTISDFLNENK